MRGRARHDILGDMNPEDLRAYARRAWHVAEALKREHWAREVAERRRKIETSEIGAMARMAKRARRDVASYRRLTGSSVIS